MSKAGLLLPRLPFQFDDKRLVPPDQAVQRFLYLPQTGKVIEPLGPSAQLAEGLRPAEQHNVNHRNLRWLQLVNRGKHVLVFRHAARAAIENVDDVAVTQGL